MNTALVVSVPDGRMPRRVSNELVRRGQRRARALRTGVHGKGADARWRSSGSRPRGLWRRLQLCEGDPCGHGGRDREQTEHGRLVACRAAERPAEAAGDLAHNVAPCVKPAAQPVYAAKPESTLAARSGSGSPSEFASTSTPSAGFGRTLRSFRPGVTASTDAAAVQRQVSIGGCEGGCRAGCAKRKVPPRMTQPPSDTEEFHGSARRRDAWRGVRADRRSPAPAGTVTRPRRHVRPHDAHDRDRPATSRAYPNPSRPKFASPRVMARSRNRCASPRLARVPAHGATSTNAATALSRHVRLDRQM
jgi:hypothetical protein